MSRQTPAESLSLFIDASRPWEMAVEAQGKSVRKPQRSWTKKGWEKERQRGGGEIGREEMERQERERVYGSVDLKLR